MKQFYSFNMIFSFAGIPFISCMTKLVAGEQARKPRSYASPKLRPTHSLTDLLTGVKCRATSVAKNTTNCFMRVDGGLAGQSQVIGLSNEFTVDTCAHLLVCPLWSKRPIM